MVYRWSRWGGYGAWTVLRNLDFYDEEVETAISQMTTTSAINYCRIRWSGRVYRGSHDPSHVDMYNMIDKIM